MCVCGAYLVVTIFMVVLFMFMVGMIVLYMWFQGKAGVRVLMAREKSAHDMEGVAEILTYLQVKLIFVFLFMMIIMVFVDDDVDSLKKS